MHMAAIETADAVAADRNAVVRREAKRVLVDAHLGAAHDIALGQWNKKEVVVPKWLVKAGEATDDLVRNEGADPQLRFDVARRTLAIAAATQGKVDAVQAAAELQTLGAKLLAATSDRLSRSRIAWELAQGLHDAMQDAHNRGQAGLAPVLGQAALKHLATVTPQRAEHDYLLGQIWYRLGAEQAVFKEDHKAAITCYAKAIPLLEKPLPPTCQAENARQGEAFISMGVSYWQANDRRRGVELTGEGVHLVEQAVRDGLADKLQLEIPYANLSNMHRELGDATSSQKYADMASRLKTGSAKR
jgi:hypothetical protein